MITTTKRSLLEVFLSAAMGLAVIVVPVALDSHARQYDAAFLPLIRNGVEGMKVYSLLFLVLVGCLIGYFGKGSVWFVGPAVLAFFPIWSIIDMVMGGDHNLFPIEWLFYALESIPGLVGAVIGRAIKRKIDTYFAASSKRVIDS